MLTWLRHNRLSAVSKRLIECGIIADSTAFATYSLRQQPCDYFNKCTCYRLQHGMLWKQCGAMRRGQSTEFVLEWSNSSPSAVDPSNNWQMEFSRLLDVSLSLSNFSTMSVGKRVPGMHVVCPIEHRHPTCIVSDGFHDCGIRKGRLILF